MVGNQIVRADATGGQMPSPSPRLAALAGAVGAVQHPGQPTRYHLQTGWAMSDLERAEAASLLSTLTSNLSPEVPFEIRDEDHPDGMMVSGQMAKGALITKMVSGLAGPAQTSGIVATSKVEMYADAIEDLPAWAIDKAIKRWARGDCPSDIKESPNFEFPPGPGTLRKMAALELDLPRRYVAMMTNLIGAISMARALDPEPMPKAFGVGPALRRM